MGDIILFILFMAALTSAISILEVVTAYFIDERGCLGNVLQSHLGLLLLLSEYFVPYPWAVLQILKQYSINHLWILWMNYHQYTCCPLVEL